MLGSNFVMSKMYLFSFSIKSHKQTKLFKFVEAKFNDKEYSWKPWIPVSWLSNDYTLLNIVYFLNLQQIYFTRLPSLICILIYSRILLTSWLLHVLWDSKNLQQLGNMTGTQLSKTGQVIGWDVCWQWEIYNLTVKALICVCKVKLKTHEISTSGHTNDIFKFANFKK